MNMIEEIRNYIRAKAEEFGAKTDNEYVKAYMERNNTKEDALKDNGAYFGFIHPEEDASGPFHDFSYTIFPSNEGKSWLICLGIGSLGFKNDYELANYPGLRRMFSHMVNSEGFCKTDFSDIETSLPKSLTQNEKLLHIKKTLKTYTKVLPCCQIVDNPNSVEGKEIICGFLAGYAKLREWATNNYHRKAINDSIKKLTKKEIVDYPKEILRLVRNRKYVVLEGPPGTGKTRMTNEISEKLSAKTFFTQFHAETSYSDFIYGIRPDINSDKLVYKESKGIFLKAVEYAQDNTKENVLLIIDEINRANLSNVLGPIFYLFEYQRKSTGINIKIAPGLYIKELPKNLHVIATMNTADRSLAVVDFALRRRFAWFTMRPIKLSIDQFYEKDFEEFDRIFQWYATSNELNLQPGHAYFLAENEEQIKERLKFELLPLIKEYLQEGLLLSAKEEFNTYFETRINTTLFD